MTFTEKMTIGERKKLAREILDKTPESLEYDSLRFLQMMFKKARILDAMEILGIDEEEHLSKLSAVPRTSVQVRKIETDEDFEALKYLDGPWRNDACLGYMIMTLKRTDAPEDVIEEMLHEMKRCFDSYTVEEAAQEYYKF